METFSFTVEGTPSGDAGFRTLRTDFGDGYTQEAGDGINVKSESWQVSAFSRLDGVVSDIMAFIDRHAGYKAFMWETPLGQTRMFKCRGGYSIKNVEAGNYRLTMTFDEVFAP